jgi:histidyl-tRNA synthetase
MEHILSTEPYKGTRDFYPEDMAVQSYIFETWAKTAELYGYERYDASILEPSLLYKSKGAENAEMVNEQTYTFVDRGEREVTLRPEMTPTVARMVAGKRRELSFPIRWYSIPNLFRYERPQRGRLREHWQLNCDMFGVQDSASDVEIIALARAVLMSFGATDAMFMIRINDRKHMEKLYREIGITDAEIVRSLTQLNDRKNKIDHTEYVQNIETILQNHKLAESVLHLMEHATLENDVTRGLRSLGIAVTFDPTLARGFDYYTGTIFEFGDTNPENNRSILGGGRYDNLTAMFGGEPISGIGFGMGDVTMHDFLISHNLLPKEVTVTAPQLVILPIEPVYNIQALSIGESFRKAGIRTAIDYSDKKIGKKISIAVNRGTAYVLVVGEDEIAQNIYTLKNLHTETEEKGALDTLITALTKTRA